MRKDDIACFTKFLAILKDSGAGNMCDDCWMEENNARDPTGRKIGFSVAKFVSICTLEMIMTPHRWSPSENALLCGFREYILYMVGTLCAWLPDAT